MAEINRKHYQDGRFKPNQIGVHIKYKWPKHSNWKAENVRLMKNPDLIICNPGETHFKYKKNQVD